MNVAEELRCDAELAKRDGGMYYSGEYLDGIAIRVESIQLMNEKLRDENAELRELVRKAHKCKTYEGCCEDCYQDDGCCPIERDMQELGIEVEDV